MPRRGDVRSGERSSSRGDARVVPCGAGRRAGPSVSCPESPREGARRVGGIVATTGRRTQDVWADGHCPIITVMFHNVDL